MIPDKESDIKPRFHKSRSHTQKHQEGDEVSSGGISFMKQNVTICMHYYWKGQVADVSILSIFCWKKSIINDLC